MLVVSSSLAAITLPQRSMGHKGGARFTTLLMTELDKNGPYSCNARTMAISLGFAATTMSAKHLLIWIHLWNLSKFALAASIR